MSNIIQNKHKQIFTIVAKPQSQDQLKLSNSNLVFCSDGQIINKIPISKIQFVLLIGEMSISTQLIGQLAKHQVQMVFANHSFGQYFYTSHVQIFGDKELKLAQYQVYTDSKFKLQIATQIVQNKINNQNKLLRQKSFKPISIPLIVATNNEQLMGIEGSVSAKYFALLFAKYNWKSRIPRAKHDINNFLLDIGYTYLFNLVSTFCTQLGYENTFGFLHVDYYQRQSLVCDLMEPIRPLIDNALVNALGRKQIKPEHFETVDGKVKLIDYRNIGQYTDIFAKALIEYQDPIYAYLRDFGDDLKSYCGQTPAKSVTTFEL